MRLYPTQFGGLHGRMQWEEYESWLGEKPVSLLWLWLVLAVLLVLLYTMFDAGGGAGEPTFTKDQVPTRLVCKSET